MAVFKPAKLKVAVKSPNCPYVDDVEVEMPLTKDHTILTQYANNRLEAQIRDALANENHERIKKIVWQLVHDYAYAVHQPHARNGGLIGLAAAAIALGSLEVARYLKDIVPPVLACFTDQDARVRYYACESMYNIAKVAKGEILVYFNEVFDALSKLSADTELSVKNGAELLDRLIKDIVSESAAHYASILTEPAAAASGDNTPDQSVELSTAFSLPKFIPLLQERITVQNPWARSFLVNWITLLNSIPDLELIHYLPSFLSGLLHFLSDSNEEVHTTTRVALDRFLADIKRVAGVQKGIAESRRSRESKHRKMSGSSDEPAAIASDEDEPDVGQSRESRENGEMQEPDREAELTTLADVEDPGDASSYTAAEDEDDGANADDEFIPGQDVEIDYRKIVAILVEDLTKSREEPVQVTCLKWLEVFLEICPEHILSFTPTLLGQLLPALAHDRDTVSSVAQRVNQALMRYIMDLPEDPTKAQGGSIEPAPVAAQTAPVSVPAGPNTAVTTNLRPVKADATLDKRESTGGAKAARKTATPEDPESRTPAAPTPEPPSTAEDSHEPDVKVYNDLDYEAAVSALTLQFLDVHEATRVASLAWLIMLHRKSPRKILAIQDATFPALLKTLSDPSDAVVTRDLLLLSQISKSSDDSYFTSFMVNLLKLFCTDRRLLETRGNLIIRQLCLSLSAERIYRTMADCLEKDEDDMEFAAIMVQNLNNNLLTAPQLADLRKRLRNLETRDGQTFFTALFKAWCVNAVATFSLCLLAQAYEQAYSLLQVFCEMEMTVSMLIQIDKLVQLLESPVFTYLRMQLLEPERYPNLYKCMYGLLMLLPQSSAFAALKNRLNSVSAIGYLHIRPQGSTGGTSTPGSVATFSERQNRLKSREDGGVRWTELLDKFRATQEKVRQSLQRQLMSSHGVEETPGSAARPPSHGKAIEIAEPQRPTSGMSGQIPQRPAAPNAPNPGSQHQKGKSSLSNLGRFATRAGTGKAKK